MHFQSEKQRRYLWANEPEIAREWTDRYGAMNGGIMNGLNRRHYLTGATGMTLEEMMELIEQNPGGALMNQGMASPYLGMNSPLNFPGEEFGETTPSWARTPQWKVDNYGLPAVGIDPILKRGSTSGSEYDPAFGELETEEKYDTSYPGSYKKSHNFYGDVQGGIPRLMQDDFYENFNQDTNRGDIEETIREQISTGKIPQNFQTRMNNPFFERPTLANAPTLANYFNQGLGGIEGVKDKMGEGWDFAKQIPGMAMSALSGIPGLGLLMGMLQESPEQKAMMGLYNTQEYQDLLNEIPGMSNYNPVYARGAGYGLSGAIDKRMARIRKTLQKKKSAVLEKRLRDLQALKDKETAHFTQKHSGLGAQGGGGGTNIGGGQATSTGSGSTKGGGGTGRSYTDKSSVSSGGWKW